MIIRNYVSMWMVACAVSVSPSAMAAIKCDNPNMLAEFEPDVVTQLIKAQGESVVLRGSLYAPETHEAFVQVRALESSGVRDHQVRQSHTYENHDVDQVLLRDPQLVKISGGGLLKPLYMALPSVIDMKEAGTLGLEKRVEGDPSQTTRDIVMTSLTVQGSTLLYTDKVTRRRPLDRFGRPKMTDTTSDITSVLTRTLEMTGKRQGDHFLVMDFVLTIWQPHAGDQNIVRLNVSLPQPFMLAVYP